MTLSKYGSKLLIFPKTFTFCFRDNIKLSNLDISPIIWNSISGYIFEMSGNISVAKS